MGPREGDVSPHGWYVVWALLPQGTAAREGTGTWDMGMGLPQLPPPIQTQHRGSTRGQRVLPPESRKRGRGRDHLPLTVPRGLCKTEGRG